MELKGNNRHCEEMKGIEKSVEKEKIVKMLRGLRESCYAGLDWIYCE